MASTSATPEQLTCVRILRRSGPDALRLPHVAKALNDFLDGSAGWTLVQACRANLLYLARRILRDGEEDPFAVEPYTSRGYRQWQFTQGLIRPVAQGNLELVELLSQHFDECYVHESVLHAAIECGRLELLQWLVHHRTNVLWARSEVEDAVRHGHLELARWLFGVEGAWRSTWSEPAMVMAFWAIPAAGNGDLPMLEWICSLSTDINLSEAFASAIGSCRLDVVKWMVEQARNGEFDLVGTPGCSDPDADKPRRFNLDGPVAAGCMEMVEWLIRYNVDECYVNGGDLEAARQGHFEIIRLLRTNNVKGCSDRVLRCAAEGGHLELVKWLYPQVGIVPGLAYNATDIAATNGFLDAVKWLHENTSERTTTLAMDGAASNGHLDVIQWLHENEEQGCTSSAMDFAAGSGLLEVVKWLHEHRAEGCTARAMDRAAIFGHVDVVKWLHKNRQEGCTTDAMDWAAARGHLSVVKWLHANRSEGCTTDAMDEAARNNHLEVVQWLHGNRTEGCTDEAVSCAATEGHAEVFEFLVSHRQEGDRAGALETALDFGNFEVARLLYQDGAEIEFVEALQKSGEACCWEFVEWCKSHGPTGFEARVVSDLLRYYSDSSDSSD
jgi:hypothetical protein